MSDAGSSTPQGFGSTTTTIGQWFHVAVAFDQSTSMWSIYSNCVRVGQQNSSIGPYVNNSNWVIGSGFYNH